MKTHYRLYILGLWLGTSTVAHGGDLRLAVHVFDYARLSARALDGAVAEASRLLGEAGVDARWTLCAVPANRGQCQMPDDGRYMIVRIVPRSAPGGGAAFGSSIKPVDPAVQGVYSTLFYSRIANASHRIGSEAHVLLGCAMAHEIGELLGLSHSAAGIMHAAYDDEDIERASRGRLEFNSNQSLQLRSAFLPGDREFPMDAAITSWILSSTILPPMVK